MNPPLCVHSCAWQKYIFHSLCFHVIEYISHESTIVCTLLCLTKVHFSFIVLPCYRVYFSFTIVGTLLCLTKVPFSFIVLALVFIVLAFLVHFCLFVVNVMLALDLEYISHWPLCFYSCVALDKLGYISHSPSVFPLLCLPLREYITTGLIPLCTHSCASLGVHRCSPLLYVHSQS